MTKDVEKNTEKKCLIYYRYSGETPPVKRRTRQLPRNPRMQPFPESIKTGPRETKWHQEIHKTFLSQDRNIGTLDFLVQFWGFWHLFWKTYKWLCQPLLTRVHFFSTTLMVSIGHFRSHMFVGGLKGGKSTFHSALFSSLHLFKESISDSSTILTISLYCISAPWLHSYFSLEFQLWS